MRHIGLKSYIGTIHSFEGIEHCFPTVHTSPTDFTFCCQFFTIISSHIASLPESLCDQFGISYRVFGPAFRMYCRINTYNTSRLTRSFNFFAIWQDLRTISTKRFLSSGLPMAEPPLGAHTGATRRRSQIEGSHFIVS